MSTNGQKIAKNAGVMMATQLITWALAFLIAIFLPQYLGAVLVGQLSIAFSIWLIMSVLLTFGMDTHLMKSVAREPEKTPDLLGLSILIRILLFAFGFVIVLLYLRWMQYQAGILVIAAIVGVSFLISLISSAISSALVGLEQVSYVSLASIISKSVHTGVTLLLLFLGFSVYWIAAVNIVSAVANLGVLVLLFRRHYQIRPRFNLQASWHMLRVSSPYMVTGLTLMVYQQIDKLFIAAMASTEAVGWYSTAMNLFGTLIFIPVALGTVLFPTLSRSHAAGQGQLAAIGRRSFDMMFMLSVPIGLGLFIIARPLVFLLYGAAFAPSGDILAILGIVLIFTYLNTMLGQLLISADRTGPWNVVMLAATVLTLPLDLVLVPWAQRIYSNGALGGALSFLLTELLMLSSAILLLPKGTLHWRNLRTTLLSLFAGVAMAGVSGWLIGQNFLLAILVGAAVYPTLMLLLRVMPQEDFMLLKAAFAGLFERLRSGKRAPTSVGSNEAL